jgi:hypothetical protein
VRVRSSIVEGGERSQFEVPSDLVTIEDRIEGRLLNRRQRMRNCLAMKINAYIDIIMAKGVF